MTVATSGAGTAYRALELTSAFFGVSVFRSLVFC